MSEWLTWQQAGERFGLSPDAVRMRARRLGWRTQPGNDGRTLVMVPDDADVHPRERSADRATEALGGHSPEQAALFARLTDLLAAADAQAERADLRAEKSEQRVEQPNKGPMQRRRGRNRPKLTGEPLKTVRTGPSRRSPPSASGPTTCARARCGNVGARGHTQRML